jgi:hypothetical protein
MSRRLLTTAEAAAYIGYDATTLRTWRSRKIGPKYHRSTAGPRTHVRYLLSDLDIFLGMAPAAEAQMEREQCHGQ